MSVHGTIYKIKTGKVRYPDPMSWTPQVFRNVRYTANGYCASGDKNYILRADLNPTF
jgi:hypothetical protein